VVAGIRKDFGLDLLEFNEAFLQFADVISISFLCLVNQEFGVLSASNGRGATEEAVLFAAP
jgi:hypothetical protein